MIGYNSTREAVDSMKKLIQGNAHECAGYVISAFTDGLVTPMSEIWYAPEGVEFFNKLAEEVKRVEPEFRAYFEAFLKSVLKALENWVVNTSGSGAQLSNEFYSYDTTLENLGMELNVSAIKESAENGAVGIVAESARNVAQQLSSYQTNLNDQIKGVAQRLDASTTFIGGGQADAATTLLTNLTQSAAKIFNFLTEGNDTTKSLQVIINEVAQKYETVASNISSTFTGAGSEPTA